MRHLHLVPLNPRIGFMRIHKPAIAISVLLVVASFVLYFAKGLNYGVDFTGGALIEVRTEGPADVATMRAQLGALDLGEVTLQTFGAEDTVLIRVQADTDSEGGQAAVTAMVQNALGADVELRRVEFVGPKVGGELQEAAIWAVIIALAGIMVYVWFRFEWQFGVAGVAALAHDVITTVGLFAFLDLEFNLTTVAAVLTIAGISINDTVVIFDRMRENLRKYKKTPLSELIDLSVNQTLSRTVMTTLATLVALLALFLVGGPVVRDFSGAMIWGMVVGTYSSVFVAGPMLIYLKLKRDDDSAEQERAAEAAPAS